MAEFDAAAVPSLAAIAAAESLLGIRYTAAERELMGNRGRSPGNQAGVAA